MRAAVHKKKKKKIWCPTGERRDHPLYIPKVSENSSSGNSSLLSCPPLIPSTPIVTEPVTGYEQNVEEKNIVTKHERRGVGVARVRETERQRARVFVGGCASGACRNQKPALPVDCSSSCFEKFHLRLYNRYWPGSEAASPELCILGVHSRR